MYKVINLRNEMDNYRYNLFKPEEKLSEKREFESYKSSKSNKNENDDSLEKKIILRIDKKIDECQREIDEYETKIKELKKNLKIYDKDKKEILEMLNKYN
jgi:ATP-binding cassette subfamily F protein 3